MKLPPTDPTLCPLCGLANQCAMEIEKTSGVAQPPCWCSSVQFETALLASIPAAAQNLACICASCAAKDRKKPANLSSLLSPLTPT